MNKISKEYFYVMITGIISGTIVFAGKFFIDQGLSLLEITIIPLVFTALILLPFIIFKKEYRFKKENLSILLMFGLVGFITELCQFTPSVLNVPVAITVLLLYTQPLWTILYSWLVAKEKISRSEVIACSFVLLGVIILVNPFNIDINNWLGILIALFGGIGLSGWVVVGSLASKKGNNPMNTVFAGVLFALILLFFTQPILAKFVSNQSMTRLSFDLPIRIFIYLLLFSLLTKIISHYFYMRGTQKVSATDAGIIMLLEPVSGAILAAIFFHQMITINIVFGGLLIIAANYLVITKKFDKLIPVVV